MRSWLVILLAPAVLGIACGNRSSEDDPASVPNPSPAGQGPHIADVADPSKPGHAAKVNTTVTVTGVVITAVDNFDETADGKSRGTIYVQDLESHAPYDAISLFRPTFVPANLVVGPGDVVDLTGQYQENNKIGTTVTFPMNEVLAQLSGASGNFRFEYQAPAPTPVDYHDLIEYSTGRKWISQLITVSDITLTAAVVTSSGRASASFANGDGGDEAPEITNELSPLAAYPAGQKFKSVTGIVTYFYNLHIAPRSQADLVPE